VRTTDERRTPVKGVAEPVRLAAVTWE